MMDEARPGQARSCSRSARSGIRLVHRGFDTLDLKAAKALLDELRARISNSVFRDNASASQPENINAGIAVAMHRLGGDCAARP